MKEKSVGGIVMMRGKVLVRVQNNHIYSFPKGHLEKGESDLNGAYREIEEEVGVKKENLKLIKELGSYERLDGKTRKTKKILMFLFLAKNKKNVPKEKKGIKIDWVKISKVMDNLKYEEDKKFFLKIKNNFS